jgi:molybdopterin-guanine dinucleotide biosynthesis protein B
MTKRRSVQKRKAGRSNRSILPPVLAVVGRSRSGKTTVLEQLIRALTEKGYAVGTIKDAKGGFQLDLEGKDSAKHYRAGARGVVIVSAEQKEVAFFSHLEEDPSVRELCRRFFPAVDVVLLEGFKELPVPKIETTRGEPLSCGGDANLVAVVGQQSDVPPGVRCFDLGDTSGLVELVERTLRLASR